MKPRALLLLTCVVVLAAFLRLYRLGEVPVNLNWDEAASGYNAYSILLTGKDEFGRSWPVFFESFNDFKHPGLIYSIVPSIALFGLTPFAVRLPSVLYGTLTVLVVFFLARRLLKHENGALLSSLLLALSPWHIQVSRVAFEQIGMIFFVVLGVWVVMKAFEHPRWYPAAFAALAASFYFYYSVRLFLPFFALGLLFLYLKTVREHFRWVAVGALVGALLLLPLTIQVLSPKGIVRASQVSIFTDEGINLHQREWRAEHGYGLLGRLLHQKMTTWASAAASGYVSHFSLPFLFFDNEQVGRHAPRRMGMMYAIELPFLLLGIYHLIQRRRRESLVLLAWFLLAPVPAMFAIPTPHALRAILMVIPLAIFVALGMVKFYSFIARSRLSLLSVFLFGIVGVWSVGYYLDNYYTHSAKLSSRDWADGHKQLFAFVSPIVDRYEKVAMTGFHWRPYIFMLFYMKVDPSTWQAQYNHAHFGKWYYDISGWDTQDQHYRPDFNWDKIIESSGTLVILSEEEASKFLDKEGRRGGYRILTSIYAADGNKMFEVMEQL